VAAAPIHAERGGEEGPLLVLLHGLGATAGVWTPMLDRAPARWPGRWLTVDLPGHGRSCRLPSYRLDDYVAALGPVLASADMIVGHSLGGVIGCALSTSLNPLAVFALGVKIDWADAELARFGELAAKPSRRFPSEEEALGYHARLSGLGQVNSSETLLARGARRDEDGWTAALDPAAFAVEAPDMAELIRRAPCPVHLACGEGDPMIGVERMRDFDPGAIAIADAGHNAMVDQPDAVWDWVLSKL
jgi:pimeloyl-ACP methyl ester carboxylesterase